MTSSIDRRRYQLPEILALVAIISLAFSLRFYCLDADPPLGLSSSTDVYTDPPQYTLFAKQYVLEGELNPLGEERFPLFVSSSVTWLAVGVFEVFGVGLYQSNLVGLLFSLGALLLFYLWVRRISGKAVGLMFLLFVTLDYNLIFYGRLPFLEHALAFHAFLALVLMSYSTRVIVWLIAGASLAVGVFFAKLTGVLFLAPFVGLIVFEMLRRVDDEHRISWRHAVAWVAGFFVAGGVWIAVVYLPESGSASAYFSEHSTALYGAPEGLKSVNDFLFKMASFGRKSLMFPRMPVAAALAAVFVGWFVYRLGRFGIGRTVLSRINSGHVYLALMLPAFYGGLMIWNYRPLRYQLVLVYAMYAAAAIILVRIWRQWLPSAGGRTPLLLYPVVYLMSIIASYQMGQVVASVMGRPFYWSDHLPLILLAALGVTLVVSLVIVGYRRGWLPFVPIVARPVVVGLAVLIILPGLRSYLDWSERPTYTAVDSSRDLAAILPGRAVVSGPFAPLLTIENEAKTIIHMFGVSSPDSNFFRERPITHLLLDQMNKFPAARNYRGVMDSAFELTEYNIGMKDVLLLRVAGRTANPAADSIGYSLFESGIKARDAGLLSVAVALLDSVLERELGSFSACLKMAEIEESADLYSEAERHYKKAVELSPTNYVLVGRLARFYRDRYNQIGDNELREKSLRLYNLAMRLAPSALSLQFESRELEDQLEWPNNPDTISSSQP